jgi:plasmid stabilization system protein ParE
LIIRHAAEEDLTEAAAWYDSARAGLGQEYLDCVQDAFDRLARQPDLGIVVHKQMRRMSVRRFPYGVFYVSYPDRIEVVAVMHARRSPRRWKKRYP